MTELPSLLVRDVRPLDADPAAPDASILCRDGVIAWLGPAAQGPDAADIVLPGGGAVVTPAFVDAHVHATATGLVLTGLDLAGATSAEELLDRVSAAHRPGTVLLGHGWDESGWRVPGRPTLAQLTRATGGFPAYLSRADLHSALATSDLLEGVEHDDGWVRLAAHHTVRARAMAAVSAGQAREAQRATLAEAARLGIGSIHEMSGPEVASAQDLRGLLELAASEPLPSVVPYWGALNDFDTAGELGAQPGGDLFVDGSFGSHTACLSRAYADEPGTTGTLRYDVPEIEAHVVGAMERGLQAGFHCIGDRAIAVVLEGLARARAACGDARMRAARHRLEHLELLDGPAISRVAALSAVASVQPAFDARWASGMYAARLGPARAAQTNPFAELHAAGVPLALGSDAPVTPLDPWGTVRAAVRARHPLTPRAAIHAHTVGGAFAARDRRRGAGTLTAGAPATLALWSGEPSHANGGTVDGWLTEVVDGANPQCLATVVDGLLINEFG